MDRFDLLSGPRLLPHNEFIIKHVLPTKSVRYVDKGQVYLITLKSEYKQYWVNEGIHILK